MVNESANQAEQMRTEHPSQFTTLVRMHLSFEIDLDFDSDEIATSEKLKSSLWSRFQKKAKVKKANKQLLEQTATHHTEETVKQVQLLADFVLHSDNLLQEGIFRKTGSLARQNELKLLLTENRTIDRIPSHFTAHDCASVLKTLLADHSEPVMTNMYYPAFCQVAEIYSSREKGPERDERLLNSLQLLFLLLPVTNFRLLKVILELLHKTICHEQHNKMTAQSLSTLFTPHLACPRRLSSEALYAASKNMYEIVSFMIRNGPVLFQVPTKLATDIQAYLVEQFRRKTLSPEQILDSSVASDSVANTVYTFVDREKTIQAHSTESTDTALAELYAYIQSLPESSRKKKLIKQFNKENGYGTPLQLVNLQRDKSGGKSLGNSIKKHIFHKNFLSRTPKRTATPLTSKQKSSSNKLANSRSLFHKSLDSPSSKGSKDSGLEMAPPLPSPSPLLAASSIDTLSSSSSQQEAAEDPPPGPDSATTASERKISFRSKSDSALNKETPPRRSCGLKSFSLGCLFAAASVETIDEMLIDEEDEGEGNEEEEGPNGDEFDMDYLTSTPSSLLRRQSMSPITKSTKRMPKSMQESIMTPRSRKPITAIESLSSENKSHGFGSLLEESEESLMATEEEKVAPKVHFSEDKPKTSSLTDNFRDYLLTRSLVVTTSPVDLSFSSQPGDYVSSADLPNLSESEMSESLLYCMNGGQDPSIGLRKRSLDDPGETSASKLAKLEMTGDELGETAL